MWRWTLSNRYIVYHRPGLNSKPFRSICVEKAYSPGHSVSSVGWGRQTWQPPWCFSRRAGYEPAPSFTFSLSSSSSHTSSYTTQTVTHTVILTSSSYNTLSYIDTRHTRNVVCPGDAWFENRPHSTSSIRLARNPKRVIVQWVDTGKHTHTIEWYIQFKNNKIMNSGKWTKKKNKIQKG